MTTQPDRARDWFSRFEGAGLDGVVVKAGDLRYQPGKRVMLKVKHERTADCVVGGFRWHKEGGVVGSLLLGLFDEAGALQHVGVASGFSVARREEFVEVLEPYRKAADRASLAPRGRHRRAGPGRARADGAAERTSAGSRCAPSWWPRWPTTTSRVDRFRHATSFVRWRPDRAPASCTYSQLDTPVPTELDEVFGTSG